MTYILNGKEVEMTYAEEKIVITTEFDMSFGYIPTLELAKQDALHFFFKDHAPKVFVVEFEQGSVPPDVLFYIVEKRKRADGQYTFKGNFMSREYIEKEALRVLRQLTVKIWYIEE